MNIAVLDGFTLNPGDLSWEPLHSLGSCKIFDRTGSKEIAERGREAEIILTNKVPLNRESLQTLPDLRFIGVTATGVNIVDLSTASERGIIVSNVPDYGTNSVAQATLALLLEITNGVGHHSSRVRDGGWSSSLDWSFTDRPLVELSGKTIGIIGAGRIGLKVANICSAIGMRVLIASKTKKALLPLAAEWVDLDSIFERSNVVSLHCPLTKETHHLVNRRRIYLMPKGSILLNTSRGNVVDEQALAEALIAGHLSAAGLDVMTEEPPPSDHPLLHAPNCVITPHNAWSTREARQRLLNVTVENVQAFLSGSPINVVNNV